MRYLGGKTKNSKAITEILKQHKGIPFVEPFCGGLNISVRMSEYALYLNDGNEDLINMYKALQDGSFVLPTKPILYDEYEKLRESEVSPLRTFVSFALSYGGKEWGGYDTYYDKREQVGKTTNMAVRSTTKKINAIKHAHFSATDYKELDAHGCLIYCDPPYIETTGYSKGLDYEEFWETMRIWSKDNIVYISEWQAPDDFEVIWEKPYKVQMCKEQQERIEKLYKLKDNK